MTRHRHFSTEHFAPRDRARAWQEHLGGALGESDYRVFNKAGLVATHTELEHDEFRVHGFQVHDHVLDRSLTMPGASHSHYYASLVIEGQASYYSSSVIHLAGPGETVLFAPDEQYVFSFPRDTAILMLELPRSCVHQDFFPTDQSVMKFGRELRTPGGLPHRELFRMVAEGVPSAETALHGLRLRIDSLLRGQSDTAIFSAAMSFISEHFAEDGLMVKDVAEAVNLSTRHLSRLFQRHDASVGACISAARVSCARQLLAGTELSLSQIAVESGFGTPANFSRVFSRHTGQSPSSYRSRRRLPSHPGMA
ncbi:AraC family transcriptional regulator [Corynebacterium hylobatis]|uniref:AraC family transcriptional regulator n=1 Tax=Corynebacterium hylobatis TaxID=1859290 RepID=A0A3S0BGB3_9CORY|nr:AraC family transcriptional regulator [Corynebacterium hylobatis]RSZ61612.1 AraC family transcriptional regulator [Corynebacterium hylobatis]